MSDRLLKKSEAREALSIGSRKLDDLIRQGDIPVIRLGARTLRVAESAVRELVEQRTERRGR